MKQTKLIQDYSAEQIAEFVPQDLEETIAFLEKVFPLELPTLKDSDREVWIKVGRQEIIQFLKNTLEKTLKQEDNIKDVWPK